jgi:hypothetical protein
MAPCHDDDVCPRCRELCLVQNANFRAHSVDAAAEEVRVAVGVDFITLAKVIAARGLEPGQIPPYANG